MCIYTLKKQNFFLILKSPQEGCAAPPNVPILDVSGAKDIPQKLTKIEVCHVTYR